MGCAQSKVEKPASLAAIGRPQGEQGGAARVKLVLLGDSVREHVFCRAYGSSLGPGSVAESMRPLYPWLS